MKLSSLFKPNKWVRLFLERRWTDGLRDETYLKLRYYAELGRWLRLDDPQTFNEKLQWLKLYDHRPEQTVLVDKYLVREYIRKTIGEEYLIPLLGVWEDPSDIDFDSLPDRFVLKCNHNSGLGMYICKDKSQLDPEAVRRGLSRGLAQDYYRTGREWPYKDVPRRVVAEQFLGDGTSDLADYKFMCFHGEVKCCFVCTDRFDEKGLHITFLDRDWSVMPVRREEPALKYAPPKPQNYETMVMLAEKLSKDYPFLRVDFYEHEDKIWFGELTFFPGSGFKAFYPDAWDETFGSWLTIPKETY